MTVSFEPWASSQRPWPPLCGRKILVRVKIAKLWLQTIADVTAIAGLYKGEVRPLSGDEQPARCTSAASGLLRYKAPTPQDAEGRCKRRVAVISPRKIF